jgi:hypothetical protein
MIEIEFEEPTIKKCECCGKDTVALTRFVHQDGNAFAVYYAKFTKGHSDKVVYGLIGLGEWGDQSEPRNRTAFPFRIWTTATNFQVGLVDASESPWSDVTYLGEVLIREEGLKHPWIKDVFHITDHMVADDRMIIDYFQDSE